MNQIQPYHKETGAVGPCYEFATIACLWIVANHPFAVAQWDWRVVTVDDVAIAA